MKTVKGQQLPTLESVSPIGKDYLQEEPEIDPTQIALSGGVGALLGSLTRSELLEDDGVEMGEHAFNGTPIIKDPFESETNYNWVVIGDSGSGKSYQTKLNALRTRAVKENTKVVILDPMQGFNGIAKAMGAKRITLGGSRGLNPLEIREPTDASRQGAGDDVDPLSEKIRDVLSFFDNFAHRQGIDLGPERMTLTTAVTEAYRRKGITNDIETHSKESPTLVDVLDVLESMARNPEEFVVRIESEAEEIEANATTLINYFRPFVDGQYQNLAQPSEFDLRDEDVVYLDLSQQEKRQSGGGLMMQLVFSLVYERAKETTDNVVFIIDEARFLMRNTANLEFLGQRVRHSRHLDSIHHARGERLLRPRRGRSHHQ
jgi:type IV secretory pathway VirB4 component